MSRKSIWAAALLLGIVLAAGTAQADRPDAGTCNSELRPPLGARIAGSFPVFSMSDARGASLRRTDDGTIARTHTVALTDGFPHFVLVLDADLAEGEWELALDDSTAWCMADFVPHVFDVGPPVEGPQLGTLSVERLVVRDIGAGLQPVLHVRVTLPAGHEALGEMNDVTLASTVDGIAVGRRLWVNLATTGVYPVPIACPSGEERSVDIAVQAMVGEEILEDFAASNTFTVRCDDATAWPPVEGDAGASGEDAGSDAGSDHVARPSGCNASPATPSSLLWLLVCAAALTAHRRPTRASEKAR
jgi:hypothetical protein